MTTVNGGTKPTATTIYTNIPCAFWAVNKSNLSQWTGALESDTRPYTANLQWHNTNVQLWDYLTLTDKSWKAMWKFLVIDIIEYPDINGKIDNIALTIKRYDG